MKRLNHLLVAALAVLIALPMVLPRAARADESTILSNPSSADDSARTKPSTSIVLAQSAAAAPTAAPAAEATSAATAMSPAKPPKVSPRALRFKNEMFAASAQTSPVLKITVWNTDTRVPVSLAGAPSIAGANASDFVVAENKCPVSPASLAAGDQCSVGITFTPTELGKRTAELSLAFAGEAKPVTIKLFGTAVSPRIKVTPRVLKFPSTTVGQSSSSVSVTITDPSPVAVKISGVGVSGPFVADSSGCSTIAAGATCTVGVIFRPVAEGKATGVLTIHSDARGGAHTIDLSATASKAP